MRTNTATWEKSRAGPRVSVVVPVLNRRRLLRCLLDALAVQTLADHEVIVVDNGSSDGSQDEVRVEAASGRPVRLLAGDGTTSTASRSIGAAAARAPYLAFTDSDCRPAPGWLAAGVAALDDGADLAQGITRPSRPPGPLERTVQVAWEDGLYATCNIFYRRAAYEAAGGFAHTTRTGSRLSGLGFGEDTLLGWRVRRCGRTAFVRQAVVEHHVFSRDLAESIQRTLILAAFPSLVREVPELRQTLLTHGLFLGGRSRLGLYLCLAAVPLRSWSVATLAGTAWVGSRLAPMAGAGWSWRRRAKALPVDLAFDALAGAALAAGSVRARTPVL